MPASPARSEPDELALDTLVSPSGGLLLQEIPDDHAVPSGRPAPLSEALSTLAINAKHPDGSLSAPPASTAPAPFIDETLLVEPSSVDELLPDELMKSVPGADEDAELMWEELIDAPTGGAREKI